MFFPRNPSHKALVWIVFPRLVLNHDQCICAKYARCSFLWLCPWPCSYSCQESFWSCSSHPQLGESVINFDNFTLQFKSLLVVQCIFIFLFFCCFIFLFSNFSFPKLKAMALEAATSWTLFAVTVKVFVFNGLRQWHGFIAFLLQRRIQFGVGVGVVTHHFPVLKLTHEWGIKC